MGQEFHTGLFTTVIATVAAAILISRFPAAVSIPDCPTVTALLSTCSSFITYGSPDPLPDSPCCEAMHSLNNLADSGDSHRAICRCVMDLIFTYKHNATAIATLPGFCGVYLGFTIDPNTDCEYIDQFMKMKVMGR